MSENQEFIRSMRDAEGEIIRRTAGNMDRACLMVERDAKINCPVDMGILRASITREVNVSGDKIMGVIGSNLEYAPYVHQGTGIHAVNGDGRKTPWCYEVKSGKYKGMHVTVGQKPNPFLEKARNSNKENIARVMGD